jgi:hypothetical protein
MHWYKIYLGHGSIGDATEDLMDEFFYLLGRLRSREKVGLFRAIGSEETKRMVFYLCTGGNFIPGEPFEMVEAAHCLPPDVDSLEYFAGDPAPLTAGAERVLPARRRRRLSRPVAPSRVRAVA